MDGPLRFSQIAQAVPELSDRLLSERMKELEARGIVERTVIPGPPLRVEYSLSQMGAELEPALVELQAWANRWLARQRRPSAPDDRARPQTRSVAFQRRIAVSERNASRRPSPKTLHAAQAYEGRGQ